MKSPKAPGGKSCICSTETGIFWGFTVRAPAKKVKPQSPSMNQQEIEQAARSLQQQYGSMYPASFASEDLLQAFTYKWWNQHFRMISLLHSVPNGGNVPELERMKLIGTGMLSGASDLELKWAPCRIAHLEMKNGPKKLDPKQEVFKLRIERLGHLYFKATNFFEAVVVICFCLGVNPTDYL